MMWRAGKTAIAALAMVSALPGVAQRVPVSEDQDNAPATEPYRQTPTISLERQRGTVADSAVGEAGRRQTRDQEIGGLKAGGRINNRIANRVQSRIRNRIDRYYDPQANAASPFEAASDQARTAGRSR
jgi:hypothetical protein